MKRNTKRNWLLALAFGLLLAAQMACGGDICADAQNGQCDLKGAGTTFGQDAQGWANILCGENNENCEKK